MVLQITITSPTHVHHAMPVLRRQSAYSGGLLYPPMFFVDLPALTRQHRYQTPVPMVISPAKSTDTCSICLEDRSECETLCGHVFHTECIKQINNDRCPMCRTIISM